VNPARIPGIMSARSDFLDSYFEYEELPNALMDNKKYILFNFYSFVANVHQKNQFYDEAHIYIKKRDDIVSQTNKLKFILINLVIKCRRLFR
jgi:hypothetical protein